MNLLAVHAFLFIQFVLAWEIKLPYPPFPIIRTRYGLVHGKIEFARSGRPFFSFRGIPYAQAPIGCLRFKAPQPPKKWTGIRDATKDGPFCIQKNYLFANPQVEGQEDCLYLNVYTPRAGLDPLKVVLLPVMVFIHWGGFLAGRGTSDYMGPNYFLDKNVVLVTFNYRLGVFGFLSTLDDVAPGNYALKDQVAVLKWVQENIHNFGGNNSRVTIFGQSAGAGSTHYHLLSPLSKGLFQAAISESGSALALWATPNNNIQPNIVAAQALFVKCENFTENSTKLIKCLRAVPARQLAESQDFFKTFFVDPLTVYTAVIETKSNENPDPFFTKLPIEYIKAGEIAEVSWIIGVVKDEGILKASSILRQKKIRDSLNNNFEAILSDLLYFSLSTNYTNDLYMNVTEKYLQNKQYVNISDPRSIQGFIDIYSDRSFIYSSYQSAVMHAIRSSKPVWFYNFAYRGLYTYGDLFASTNKNIAFDWGVSHCDDLLYLFNSPGLFPPLSNDNDIGLSHTMINMWTNFATYGDPNPPQHAALQVNWQPLDIKQSDPDKNEKFCFLNLTGDYKSNFYESTTCGFHKERITFWTEQNVLENVGVEV